MEEKDDYHGTAREIGKPSLKQRVSQSSFANFCRRHKVLVGLAAMLILLLPLLGLLALRDRHHARAEYTSPVVYPSREYPRSTTVPLRRDTDKVQPLGTVQATGLPHTRKPRTQSHR